MREKNYFNMTHVPTISSLEPIDYVYQSLKLNVLIFYLFCLSQNHLLPFTVKDFSEDHSSLLSLCKSYVTGFQLIKSKHTTDD